MVRMSRTRNAAHEENLTEGRLLSRSRFESEHRWSILTRRPEKAREGYIELGELCEVHRGQVTGANRIWIAASNSSMLPESVLFPCVTRAKELFAAGDVLCDVSHLRDVIDIPPDLSIFEIK